MSDGMSSEPELCSASSDASELHMSPLRRSQEAWGRIRISPSQWLALDVDRTWIHLDMQIGSRSTSDAESDGAKFEELRGAHERCELDDAL